MVQPSRAEHIGTWAAGLSIGDIPERVQDRARGLILDAIGVGLAASTFDFADRARAAVEDLVAGSEGDSVVIGSPQRLPLRDAVLLNGTLIHGIDFDDTYLPGTVHPSASALPLALGVSHAEGLSADDLLVGYVLAMEITGRVAAVAGGGGLIAAGFHPTGVAGAFGCAVAAGRLLRLPSEAIAQAQGFVGSLASGSVAFATHGTWTKRVHPGWAAVAGLTAASFARRGFSSPTDIYEGPLGFYASHTRPGADLDLETLSRGLGERWVIDSVAVKPLPACHYTHSLSDAAVHLRTSHQLSPHDIAKVTCRIAPAEATVIFDPIDVKRAPCTAYAAQFSGPYVVAASLARGRFTLAELEADALTDPTIRELASKVGWEADPDSAYPRYFSGEVVVETTDGRRLTHREHVNRGADEKPLSPADLAAKFSANAALAVSDDSADAIRRSITGGGPVEELVAALQGQPRVDSGSEPAGERS